MHFVETLLTAYDLAAGGPSEVDQAALPDLQTLRIRAQRAISWLQQLRRAWRDVARIASYYRGAPAPLAVDTILPPQTGFPIDLPAFLSHTFSDDETTALLNAARDRNVSVNTYLFRDVFLGLDSWNRAHGARESRWLRIAMPVNIRPPSDKVMSAFNAVTMAFIDRSPRQLADRDRLLETLRDELEQTRDLRERLALIPVLHILGKFKGAIQKQLETDRCLSSSVFSNFGVLFARSPLVAPGGQILSGGVILERVEAVPPVRPKTYAAFAAMSYAGRLNVNISYDHRTLTAGDAAEMLARCVAEIRRL
jgi:hypothetical protein